ncbi:MAG: GNAT family N-acetyltransferase [Candidatus Bathyarchaeota archaeon]|nr:GNAT family N-acetyltransferase [Candidatus Bathyarchaeota archaeon]
MRWCDYHKILYDGRIVGALIVSKKRAGHYECARVFVDPEYQNRGMATRAFEQAWDMYPDAIIWTLGTPEWNVRTKHFYEKLGFVQVGWTREEPEWRGRYYEKLVDANQLYERMKIADLTPGMREVEVEAKVLEVSEPRQVRSRKTGEPLRVAEAVISDETGPIKLVLWNDQIRQVKADEKIRIENGYVTSFRGEKELNIGRYGTLAILL